MRKHLYLICIIFALFISEAIALDYTVRVIYFKPVDKVTAPDRFKQILLDVQQGYASEMKRHGYPNSFRLESDAANEVIIHQINGKHNAAHYAGDTSATVMRELPDELKRNTNIHLVIMADMRTIRNGIGGYGYPITGGNTGGANYGGFAFIAERHPLDTVELISHELGHCFGLYHNILDDENGYIMGAGVAGLHEYEARWLSKHHYFNDVHTFNKAPRVTRLGKLEAMHDNTIQLRIDVEDTDLLHQAQVLRPSDTDTLAWDYLTGNKDIITFQMQRRTLLHDNFLWIMVMDIFGNYNFVLFKYTSLPAGRLNKHGEKDPTTNKNLNLKENAPIVDTEEPDNPVDKEDTTPKKQTKREVAAKFKVHTSWARLKQRL